MKLSEAAKALGISAPTINRWVKSHADVLHPTRIGLIWHLDAKTVQDVKSGKIKITFDKKKVKKKA